MKTMMKLLSGSVALAILAILLGRRMFNRIVLRDVEALFREAQGEAPGVVTAAMLEGLPPPIVRYLTYSGVVGKPLVRTVYLKQQGTMRAAAGQPWIPIAAEQYYSVQPPGFVWSGFMHLGPLPLVRARDRYLDGHGNMLISAGGLYPIVEATGKEMDQGSFMRYLSEMIWFPTAFLGENVSFAPVDDTSARVTLTDHGQSVTGTLSVDGEGRPVRFVAGRYRMTAGGYELDTWSALVSEYGDLAGLKLPIRAQAVWNLAEGDLPYFDVRITDLVYSTDASPAARRRSRTQGCA